MKNIHILPTENYSPLVHSTSKYGGLFLSKYYSPMKVMGDSYQHIYITSDEEIKEGNWCYNSINNNVYKKEINKLSFAYEYKIILTTDQDLIKDGVQKIADEFLEWFVKNPSCESIEIRKEMYIPQSNGKISDGKITHEISLDPSQNTLPYYKINIPKEELNPTTQVVREAMRIVSKDVRLPKVVREGLVKEEPKQETLEEASNKIYPNDGFKDEIYDDIGEVFREKFIEGAKWQQYQDRWKLVSEETPPTSVELLVKSPNGVIYLSNWRESYQIFFCQEKSESSLDWKWKTI